MFSNLRYKVLAVVTAFLLWGVAHSSSPEESGFDVAVVVKNAPSDLVVTDRSSDALNVRVRGSRAALRRLALAELKYPVDLSGARSGTTEHEVDLVALDLPRGAQIVSRSPASLTFTLERKSTRAVKVRPDLDGDPAPGYALGKVEVEPARLRISGARSEVLRMSEVLTETIDVTGVDAPIERKVRAAPGGLHVWLEGTDEVIVRIDVAPIPVPEAPPAVEVAPPKRKKG